MKKDMSDKERIEKEALAFAVSKDVATCSYHHGCRVGYIAGALSERTKAWNDAIDACIDILSSTPGDQNFIPSFESLKHKQP